MTDLRIFNVDLSGKNFSDCNLEGVRFSSCNLSNCDFTGCNLKGAVIRGCKLTGSKFNVDENQQENLDALAREVLVLHQDNQVFTNNFIHLPFLLAISSAESYIEEVGYDLAFLYYFGPEYYCLNTSSPDKIIGWAKTRVQSKPLALA